MSVQRGRPEVAVIQSNRRTRMTDPEQTSGQPTSAGLVLAAPEIGELQTVGRVTEPPRGLDDERQSSRVRSTRISVHRTRPLFGST